MQRFLVCHSGCLGWVVVCPHAVSVIEIPHPVKVKIESAVGFQCVDPSKALGQQRVSKAAAYREQFGQSRLASAIGARRAIRCGAL
ncbi:hypothetical protein SAMN04488595_1291 [Ralstonia sp. 25mfcol4.1]|nr:hypothetical protein SAMN04488595_1291 [Ralstonia sp. 25mfcol4.1]